MRYSFAICVILITVLCGVFAFRSKLLSLLNSWGGGLILHHEPVTELYIDNYTYLPTLVRPAQLIPISFTIHNVEGSTKTYTYQVTAQTSTKTDFLDQKTISVQSGAYANITVDYTVHATRTPATVVISLVGTDKLLHVQIPRRS